jgi:SRSO17 transposase
MSVIAPKIKPELAAELVKRVLAAAVREPA